jgi:hypothetical protein
MSSENANPETLTVSGQPEGNTRARALCELVTGSVES